MLLPQARQYNGRMQLTRPRALPHNLRPQANAVQHFFNREAVASEMKGLLERSPVSVTLIVGPRNAGKTTLLKHLLLDGKLVGTRCFIDCRAVDVTSPEKLANALLKSSLPPLLQKVSNLEPQSMGWRSFTLLAAFLSLFSEKLKSENSELTLNLSSVSAVLKEFIADKADGSLPTVTQLYEEVLTACNQVGVQGGVEQVQRPVLVLDEANVLMHWGKEHQSDLETLFRFFVCVTKVDQRANVVLSTSEYSFMAWIQRGLGASNVECYCIGEFSEFEARQFFNAELLHLGHSPAEDQHWREIYQVCGGNAGALKKVAATRHNGESWAVALARVIGIEELAFESAFDANPTCGYTCKDFACVVKMILSSPFYAVSYKDVQRKVGNKAYTAMIKANLIGIRPYTSSAKDIDPKAFGPNFISVVTAPTAVLFRIWQTSEVVKEMLDLLPKKKKKKKKVQLPKDASAKQK